MLDFIPTPLLSIIALLLAAGFLGAYLVGQFGGHGKDGGIGKQAGIAWSPERRTLGLAGALGTLFGAILAYQAIAAVKDEDVRFLLASGFLLWGGGFLLAMAVFRTAQPQQLQQPGLRLISKDQDGNAVVTPFERRKKDR